MTCPLDDISTSNAVFSEALDQIEEFVVDVLLGNALLCRSLLTASIMPDGRKRRRARSTDRLEGRAQRDLPSSGNAISEYGRFPHPEAKHEHAHRLPNQVERPAPLQTRDFGRLASPLKTTAV